MTVRQVKALLDTVPEEDLDLPMVTSSDDLYSVVGLYKQNEDDTFFSEDLSEVCSRWELNRRQINKTFLKIRNYYVIN
jgi:hypothetical protein